MVQAYKESNKDYSKNGDMVLMPSDAVVSAELNGVWSLSMHHPIDKMDRWKSIDDGGVIDVPSFNGQQKFRIVKKNVTDGGVEVEALPIFLDAKNDCFLVDSRPTNKNGQQALDIMCSVNTRYSGKSDITRATTAYYEYVNLIEAINGDSSNSFLNRWGGEILYDNFSITINERVGGDYAVELRYGKNLAKDGLKVATDFTETATRIYPKAFNGRKLSGTGYVDSPLIDKYPTVKAKVYKFENVKLKQDVDGEAEENIVVCENQSELDAELRRQCEQLFANGLDKPKVTITADMVLLQDTEEYKDFRILETVSLGDTIHCYHTKLGIKHEARVVKLEYDCLQNRVTKVVLGDFKGNYVDRVESSVDKIEGVITPDGDLMGDKVVGILNAMKTQLKYQKDVAHKQDVRAILFEDLDTESPTYGALCIGTKGFEISNRRTADGRDWEWRTAGTANGFVADAIVTGILTDKTGKNYWNLDTGDFQLVGAGGGLSPEEVQGMVDQGMQNAIQESAKALLEYANTVTKDFENIQKQVDGQVEDWYYDYEPTPSNAPASTWGTEADRKKHEGDRFFWKSKGYAYRWMKDGNTWKWVLLKDTDITTAMKTASEAKDVADGKRRTFVTRPEPPYDVGDLWMDGADILTCTNPKVRGAYFDRYDWKKLNKYTDDTVANEALQNSKNPVGFLTQDQVFNKLTNNGALQGIFMRDGKLYINGKYIEADTLSAITANLGQVNSANINNYLDGVKVFELRENIITFFDKYESRTNGGVGPIQEHKDEYGTELWSTLFAQMVCGSNYFRVTKDWADLHCNRISVNGYGDLTKYSRMNVLWSGSYWMTNAEEAVFTEPVSNQPHGIVLVFSATNGTNTESPGDWWWNSVFVPRPFIIDHPWETYSISLTGGSDMVGYGRKMLGFHDTKIIGYEANKNVYEVAGLKYENNRFVLRYVYGV